MTKGEGEIQQADRERDARETFFELMNDYTLPALALIEPSFVIHTICRTVMDAAVRHPEWAAAWVSAMGPSIATNEFLAAVPFPRTEMPRGS